MVRRRPRPTPATHVAEEGDTAVITCHFNWAGFKRPVQNLCRFLRQMARDEVPVYGVEVQIEGSPFATAGNKNWHHIHAGPKNILFQKEALLNLAASRLPAHFTKVAWIDADLWFEEPDWLGRTSAVLENNMICQPFGQAWWTDRDGSIALGKPPSALVGIKNSAGHPGFAWAARRTFFTEADGLYSLSPVGSGDSILATVLFNQNPTTDGMMFGVGLNHTEYHRWAAKVEKWLDGTKVAFVPGSIWHEWHGERQNRQYVSRREILRTFDCHKHLQVAPNGLIQWREGTPAELSTAVREYFIRRQEDG